MVGHGVRITVHMMSLGQRPEPQLADVPVDVTSSPQRSSVAGLLVAGALDT
jgi:hypothetical protein